MKKLCLLCFMLLLVNQEANAKWYHYAIGGAIGYLAGKQEAQGTPPPPQPITNHSVIRCYSSNGFLCTSKGRQLKPSQVAGIAGYKIIYRSYPDPTDARYLLIEAGN